MKFLKKNRCFIIAELSGNHNGKLSNLMKMIYQAKLAGADAVKIQAYEAEGITMDSDKPFFKLGSKSKWKKYENLYRLYKKGQTPRHWYKKIFSYANKIKIILFASVFDLNTIDYFEKKLNCPIYKVASPEIEDLELIEKIAKTKKPLIVSTGIANDNDIIRVIEICKKSNNYNVILLNCISSYPAKKTELNLKYINVLKKYCPIVGYSDHSDSDLASIISVANGAKVIEKHFILNKRIKSPDSSFSYDPVQFKNLVNKIRDVEVMLGSEKINKKKILKDKLKTVSRSIFYSRNILKGDKINLSNIKSVRPGTGLNLKYFKKIIGKRVKNFCKFGQPVRLKDIIL